VARPRYPSSEGPLPPPLPPETRTVGQLVAESVRFYGAHFWRSLALGVGPGVVGVVLATLPGWWDTAFVVTGGALLLTASYVAATLLVFDARADARSVLEAQLAGAIVFVPFPFLASIFVLPGVAWLAFVGLVVPVALVERPGFRASFRRAVELARADYVHALGSLAALVITSVLTATVLFFLLRGQGQAALSVAAFLALLVISPVVLIGSALLYVDQAARVRSSKADGALPRGKPPASGPVRHPSAR
jgi:hypothetical protein